MPFGKTLSLLELLQIIAIKSCFPKRFSTVDVTNQPLETTQQGAGSKTLLPQRKTHHPTAFYPALVTSACHLVVKTGIS